MELNTVTLGDFVKLADVLWEKGFQSIDQSMRNSGLVKVVNIPANTGNTREFSEIDLQEYAKLKTESDQAERAQVQQGWTKTMTQKRVALDIGISYEMRTMNKYPEVVSKLTGSGRTVGNRMDLDLSHRITFAASTSYTNMDGKTVTTTTGESTATALADSTHDLRGSATTYRNILANNPRLSKGALEGMERLIVEETYNQFGEQMQMPFDILFTTNDSNTVNTAREYLQSTADVGGANSGVVNVYASKYRHVVLPRLMLDANGASSSSYRYYWGLASSVYSSLYLGIWEEPRLLNPIELGKESDEDWDFGVRGGYGIVTVSAAWIKISKGDGTE